MAVNNTPVVGVYRIIHFDNLAYILQNGMFVRGHKQFDPDYVNIGDPSIISTRDIYPVKIPGYGHLGDYVPFYFGRCSMMLYNILTGYRVPKQHPKDIVYLCCTVDSLTAECGQYFFTDGQANTRFTDHFSDLADLAKVDWETVNGKDFKKSGADPDKPRRYQAEFLVHNHVPISCVKAIVVYNEARKQEVEQLVVREGLNIKVLVATPRNNYYFHY